MKWNRDFTDMPDDKPFLVYREDGDVFQDRLGDKSPDQYIAQTQGKSDGSKPIAWMVVPRLKAPRGGSNPKPVTFAGITYATTKGAATALGVTTTTIRKWRDNPKAYEYSMNRKELGFGQASQPIEIRGVLYLSMKHASQVLGISYQTVQSARKRGRLDSVGLRRIKRPRKAPTLPVPIWET